MRLTQVLASQVTSGSRSRGESYFRSGAVRSISIQNGIIEATVKGGEPYTVWIEPNGTSLIASCSCPYFFDRVDVCKHIWAVVLAAEDQAIPLVAPGIDPQSVSIDPMYVDEDFDDEPSGYAPPRPSSVRGAPFIHLTPPPPPPPPRVPAWKPLLDSLASGPVGPPGRFTQGQLLYVIDAPASTTSGSLVLELMTRDRKTNGEWGKPKAATVMPADVTGHPDPAEREILERLAGARPYSTWGSYSAYGTPLTRLDLRGAVAVDVIPRICATERCLVRATALPAGRDAAPPTQVSWDDGPAWQVRIVIHETPDDGGYEIDGWLARGEERMEVTAPIVVLQSGLIVTASQVARFDARGAFAWLTALRRSGRIRVPRDARDALVDALVAASPDLGYVPDDLRVERVQVQPRRRVRLQPMRYRADRLRVELVFDYDGHLVPFDAPARVVRAPGGTRAIERDASTERAAIDRLYQLGCRHDWSQDAGKRELQIPTSQMPRLVRLLLDESWLVEAEGRSYRRPGHVALDVRSGIDWFELHGHVDFDDQRATLPALLAALDRGDGFVVLGDGTVGLLPEEWLRRHAPLARAGAESGDHLRFHRSQAALVDALIAAQPAASWDETFARTRAELQAFDGIKPVDPHESFTGTLRAYQRDGLGWLQFLQRFGVGGCLADDMGLGKTVMVLALMAERGHGAPGTGNGDGREHRPSLVVAPRSVVFNWRQEAARFTPHLRVLEYVGGGRSEMRETFAQQDLVLTTYGTLRRDAADLATMPFDYVVLDEAQAIKNAATVSAKTTRLLQARHRLALSGTPIENHLGELWSLFEFLNPGLLGRASAFGRLGSGPRPDAETLALMSRALRPFILRRTKEQVASDLPPKTEQTLYCELERPQRVLYDELLAHYRRTLLGVSEAAFGKVKLQVLEALLRLRQAACHPGLIDPRRGGDASAKLDVLVPRLNEAVEEGHKTLVFSQFTSLLALLRARLDEQGIVYEYLDGRTRDRQAKVERFQQDPACRVFLISLKAGGLGLNLTAAEYVFLLDPWWNPAVEAQAIDRAHRIGQSRHVFAYRLIARDTVEERVLELQQHKRQLADAILTADKSLIRDLRREDLEVLLS
jgi:superfamily II DNA or RNA helicase